MTIITQVKSVKRIVFFGPDGSRAVVKARRSKKRKKQSRWLKPIEKRTRRLASGVEAGADTYVGRHDRSNQDKTDGWMLDLPRNMMKSERKAAKKIKILKL